MEIRLDHITKKYGKITALNDINLTFSGTGCTGLLGPNGAGKTTMLKLMTNIIRPTHGEVTINGINVSDYPERALSFLGSLIEQPEFYGYLTSREILNFTGKIKGLKNEEIKSEIDRLSKITQISGFLDRKTGGYSRGMKQRLALSVALMGNPEIVVLDEPTFGLDPKGMSEIHSLIKEISRDKLVILSTHLLYEARDLCNRVIIINSGTIGHDSKTEENREMLKITLESDYNNNLDGNIHPFRVNGNEIILEKPPDMHNDEIINMISRNGMHVKYVEKYDDLEEIYISLTKDSGYGT